MPERGEALSERELEVLRLAATGASNDQIARQLVLSANTIKVHLRNIYTKLGVASRTEASLYAVRQGWVTLENASAEALEQDLPSVETESPAEEVPPEPVVEPRQPARWQRFLAIGGPTVALLVIVILGLTFGPKIFTPVTPGPTTGVVPTKEWKERASLLHPRSDLALVAFSGALYAIGGKDAGGASKAVERFDPDGNTWSALKDKPTAVAGASAAVIGGHIYVPGGCDAQGKPTTKNEVYVIALDQWTTASPLPYGLCRYALVASEGKLLLFGGWDGADYRDEVLIYSPETDRWDTAGRLPFAAGDIGAVVVENQNQVLLVGGVNKDGPLNVTVDYDLVLAACQQPHPLSGVTLGSIHAVAFGPNDLLYVLAEPEDSSSPQLWTHVAKSDMWQVDVLPGGQLVRGAAVAGIETQLFLVGGYDGQAYLSQAWEVQAIFIVGTGRAIP